MKTKINLLAIAFVAMAAMIVLTSLKFKDIDPKDIKGAWEQGPAERKSVMIVTDKVFSVAIYDGPGKKFIGAYGGTWKAEGNEVVYKMEWNTDDASSVGTENSTGATVNGDKLVIGDDTWTRVDDGKPTDLTGAWIITGNYANDKVSKRPAPFFPRRTMKVLSGSRFHWIAYNVQTKEFVNAGGGTYTAKDGKYIEHVDFFTKTPESVGKTLNFQYAFVDGDWRHKGEKSTGGPMDECWSRRETLEK